MTETARSRGVSRALALSTSREALLAVGVLVVQIVAVLAYFATTSTTVLSLRETLYPLAWITLSVYFVATLWRHGPDIRSSRAAVAVGAGYLLVLATVGGLVWPGTQFSHHASGSQLMIVWSSPGWGPTVLYSSALVQGTIVPFKLIGYAALAYGVAAAVAASSRGAFAGVVGLFSCVGCMLPIIGVVAGVFGGSATVTAAVGGSYDLGTLVFAGTIVLLLVAIPTTGSVSKTDTAA